MAKDVGNAPFLQSLKTHEAVVSIVNGQGELVQTLDVQNSATEQLVNFTVKRLRSKGASRKLLPMRLRLATGMLVTITHNLHVGKGIVNGAKARVVSSVLSGPTTAGFATLEMLQPAPGRPKIVYVRPVVSLLPMDPMEAHAT